MLEQFVPRHKVATPFARQTAIIHGGDYNPDQWLSTDPEILQQDAELMTWDEIRELRNGGMSIGSHTNTHTVLATLPGEEQRRELEESKAALEERLGAPVRSIAYPVGTPAHFTAETCRLAQEAGYEAAFSFATGTNSWPRIHRFAIGRVSAPDRIPLFIAKVRMPLMFAAR